MSNFIKSHDVILLDFWFKENVKQSDVNKVLDACDIEVLGATKALILAYAMQKYPRLDFGQYATPRLKGVLNFYRFSNLGFLAHFFQIASLLNKADVPFLPMTDLALKMLRPELPRPLPEIGLITKKEFFGQCKDILAESPYSIQDEDLAIFHNGTRIGRFGISLDKENNLSISETAWKTAQKKKLGLNSFSCPSVSEILFMLLREATVRLEKNTDQHALIFSVTDASFIADQIKKNDECSLDYFANNTHLKPAWDFFCRFSPKNFN